MSLHDAAFLMMVILSCKAIFVLFSEPSISPRNITAQKMTETSFNISWNALSRIVSNGDVIAYEVMHTRKSKSGMISAPVYQNTTTTTSVTLLDLTSCSQYSVYVRAYTSAGPGPFGALPSGIVTNGRYLMRGISYFNGDSWILGKNLSVHLQESNLRPYLSSCSDAVLPSHRRLV